MVDSERREKLEGILHEIICRTVILTDKSYRNKDEIHKIYYMIPTIMELHTLWYLEDIRKKHKPDSLKQLSCNKLPKESYLWFKNLYLTGFW